MHLSKEELELCEWIHKFMKDNEDSPFEKNDKKSKKSPSLLEVYNYTKSDMMTHLKRINEKKSDKIQ